MSLRVSYTCHYVFHLHETTCFPTRNNLFPVQIATTIRMHHSPGYAGAEGKPSVMPPDDSAAQGVS